MRVRKDDLGRVRVQDYVAELNAAGCDDITHRIIMFGEEAGEIVKEDEEQALSTTE